MKRVAVAVVAVAILLSVAPGAYAGPNVQSPGKFGIGLAVGYPHEGVSINWFMSQNTSLQIDATIWLRDNWKGFGGRGDLLWWMPKLAKADFGDLGWYWGPGVNVFSFTYDGPGEADGYVGVGAELAVGIGLQFAKLPIDLNLEAVPVLHILGSEGVHIDFDILGVLNARYYF